jgi:hypothetical protein
VLFLLRSQTHRPPHALLFVTHNLSLSLRATPNRYDNSMEMDLQQYMESEPASSGGAGAAGGAPGGDGSKSAPSFSCESRCAVSCVLRRSVLCAILLCQGNCAVHVIQICR